MKKLNTKQFIERAKKIHKNKYIYNEKTIYQDIKTKICIICPEHGEFWQSPDKHLRGQGCPHCGKIATTKSKLLTTEIFIERSHQVHKLKYSYEKSEYINSDTPVCITCPIHGDFWQLPNAHLKGVGCPKCNQSHLEKKINDYPQ